MMTSAQSVEKFVSLPYPSIDPLCVCKSRDSDCLLLCIFPMDGDQCSFNIFKHDDCLSLDYELRIDCRGFGKVFSCGFESVKIITVDRVWFNVFGDNKCDEKFIHVSKALFYAVCRNMDQKTKVVHFLLDMDSKRCIELKSPEAGYSKLLYIRQRKELMMLGSYGSDRVWVCNLSSGLLSAALSWQLKSEVVMPFTMSVDVWYDVAVFADVVFVFYWTIKTRRQIFCLDLDTLKWYKCKQRIPDALGFSCVLKHYCSGDVSIVSSLYRKHMKVNVYDLIPEDLVNDKRNSYKYLLMGFVRKQCKDKCVLVGCKVLIDIVLHYIPFLFTM